MSHSPQKFSEEAFGRGMNNTKRGRMGECIALKYLEQKGYTIITSNYHTRYGEIDIIAKDQETLAFVEVKARSSMRYGRGVEAVTESKQEKLRKTALLFLQEKGLGDHAMRFDVIDIMFGDDKPDITHIEYAF